MPAGPVVLNNTPLVALTVLGRLELLRNLFGEVLITEFVRDEFLAVAEERSAGFLVIDEKKARRYAERMKFSLTGTLGLLLLTREQGLIESITREIEALQEAGLYMAPSLIARARELAGESLTYSHDVRADAVQEVPSRPKLKRPQGAEPDQEVTGSSILRREQAIRDGLEAPFSTSHPPLD